MRAGSNPCLLAAPVLVSLAWGPFYHDTEGIVALKAGILFVIASTAAALGSPLLAVPVAVLGGFGALAWPEPLGAAQWLALGGALLAGIAAARAEGANERARIPLSILSAGLLGAVLLAAQRFAGLFSFLKMPETDFPSATFPNRNLLATLLAAAFAVACSWALSGEGWRRGATRWSAAGLLLAALLSCRTEGALAGAALALLLLASVHSWRPSVALGCRIALGLAPVLVVGGTLLLAFWGPRTLGLLPGWIRGQGAVVERVALWTIAGARLRAHPFEAAGPGGFETVRDAGLAPVLAEPALNAAVFVSPHAHNDWLEYAVEGTVLTPVLGMLLAGFALRKGLRRLANTPTREERFALEASAGVLTVVLVHSFVHFPLHLATPLLLAGMSVGVLLGGTGGRGGRGRESRTRKGLAVFFATAFALLGSLRPVQGHRAFEAGQRSAESGRFREAAGFFESSTERFPGWSLAWENLAAARAATGDLRQAEEAALAAVTAGPHSASAWANLGGVRGLRGNLEGAEEAFRTALALNPRLEPARQGLRGVEERRRRGSGRVDSATPLD